MIYYIVATIKTMFYCRRKRHIDQWNWIYSAKIDQHDYAQLIFDTHTKLNQWRKVFFKNWTSIGKIIKLFDLILTVHTKY